MEEVIVLAVGAHPDDVEFGMAGTLARLWKMGFKIHIATVATGDMGSAELRPEEIARIRFHEATRAARILSAEYSTIGCSDLHIFFDDDTRKKTVELLRRVNARIVFTSSPQDYMKDHEITSELLWDACFSASVRNYYTESPNPAKPLQRIPHLYYADPSEGKDKFGSIVKPDFYVDITDTMDIKIEMLRMHESQRSWLLAQHGIDEYIEHMKKHAEMRGREVGMKYAEAFRQHKGHAFPQDNILEKSCGIIKP
jgi:LmbE family N-acetylglucosaminyl deacetylase